MASLSDWFVCYSKAHGTYAPGTKGPKGKVEGKATTVSHPLTEEAWAKHISGDGPGVGIIALLDDNTVRFGVIDVDSYQMDLVELSRKVDPYPLVLFRSKSGGAHLCCFVTEPVPATDMIEYLTSLSGVLGFAGSEIFPKQSSRSSDKDVGNWINAPYFNAEHSVRYALRKGKGLLLDEALLFIAEKALTPDGLAQAAASLEQPDETSDEPEGDLFSDGPPCLQRIAAQGGFGDGSRNEGMFNVAVYCKKRDPDTWQDDVFDFRRMCDPPMEVKDLQTTVKSLTRKDYSYKCSQQPIKPFCNRKLCLKRPYGVGQTVESSGVEMTGLTKYEGDPVLWVMELNSRRLELTTDELLSQNAFARKCADVLTMLPAPIPQARWVKAIQDIMHKADIVAPAQDEETSEGLFWAYVERFCVDRSVGTSRDQVATNYPFTEDGFTYFKGVALLDYLNRSNFRYRSARDIWRLLSSRNAIKATWEIKGRSVNLWGVKEFREDDDSLTPLPNMGGEGNEF